MEIVKLKYTHIHTDVFLYSLDETIFIGDALSDRNAAKENGLKFIGRYTTVEEIKNEKYLIKDFKNFNLFINKLK